MDRGIGAAARLPGSERRELAIHALAGSETVSGLAAQHGVSRKFVYQQTHKARTALDDAFSPATPDDGEVLFELAVTRTWLRQVIVGLPLICRSSYRGVVEFVRDLLGVSVSLGNVHDVLQAATQRASTINREQDLSGIRVGLHDELFQGATPVLAGVDAQSTFCYLRCSGAPRRGHLGRAPARRCRAVTAARLHDCRRRAGLARRAEDSLGRHALSWRCVSHPTPLRGAGQHAAAPRPGCHVAAQGTAADVVRSMVTGEGGLALLGRMMAPSRVQRWCEMDRGGGVNAAAEPSKSDRKELATRALADHGKDSHLCRGQHKASPELTSNRPRDAL